MTRERWRETEREKRVGERRVGELDKAREREREGERKMSE